MANIAVAGISGKVGDSLRRYCPDEMKITGLVHKSPSVTAGLATVIDGFDITDEVEVIDIVQTLARSDVRTIINCAGHVDVDGAEKERDAADPATLSAYRLNTLGAEILADACARVTAKGTPVALLHLSSESVFTDSNIGEKFKEEDPPCIPTDRQGPLSYKSFGALPTLYGLTKALGERKVLEKYRHGSVVVRMHGVQGPQGGFFSRTASEIQRAQPFTRVSDMYVAHLTDAAIACALFTIERAMHDPKMWARGVYHLSARTAMTPYEITLQLADHFQKPRSLVTPILLKDWMESSRNAGKRLAARPHYTILGVSKFEREFYCLPTAEESVDHFAQLYGHLY